MKFTSPNPILKYLRSCHTMQVQDANILSLKLAAQRERIQKVDIQYMAKTDSEFTFSIAWRTKTSKQGKKMPVITFHIFPEEESLCPYKIFGKLKGIDI